MDNEFTLSFNFSTKKEEEIRRCLNCLYSTKAGSQPMDREFGIDYEQIVGYPIDVAENKLALEIIEKTEKYETRVKVESVSFDINAESGQLIPTIKLIEGDDDIE